MYLTHEEKFYILQNQWEWHPLARHKFHSLCNSIKKYDNISQDDIISDFYIYIKDKNIMNQNGLIISLNNYSTTIINKKKKKNFKHKFDRHIYHKYYDERFDGKYLSTDDKRFLTFFIAKYIKKDNVKPQDFNIHWILKEKGVNIGEKTRFCINKNKLNKSMMIQIMNCCHYVDMDIFSKEDRLFIQYVKDCLIGKRSTSSGININMGIDRYIGKIDVFDNRGLKTKENKITNMCKVLLTKIIKNMK